MVFLLWVVAIWFLIGTVMLLVLVKAHKECGLYELDRLKEFAFSSFVLQPVFVFSLIKNMIRKCVDKVTQREK